MKTTKTRLQLLEERLSQTSGQRQLALYSRCILGDRQAIQDFERIIASGKAVPLLANLLHLFQAGPGRPIK